MTAYTWPTGIKPKRFGMRVMPSTLVYTSPYSKSVQAVDLMSEVWRLELDVPDGISQNAGGQLEAFFDRLKGAANTVTLWNMRRPAPLGTARGVLTLGANAAQLANTANITGARTRNLQPWGGMELDSNSDGLSDGLTADASGSGTGAVSYSRSAGPTGMFQQIAASALASPSVAGVRYATQAGAASAGSPVAVSFDAYGTSGTASLLISIDWYNGASFLSTSTATAALPGSWSRVSASLTAPGSANGLRLSLYIRGSGAAAAAYVNLDNVQVEQGAATAYTWPPTLLAGDMLGINGQLVRVMQDATADDSGTFSGVEFAPRLRTAQSSGASVTWSAPTGSFYLAGDGAPIDWTPGMYAGPSLQFIEAV